MLTGEHPFDAATVLGGDPRDAVAASRSAPRDIVPSCPLLLEDLCLAMLAEGSRPSAPSRPTSVAAEVEAFLEGAKERERAAARRRDASASARRSRSSATSASRPSASSASSEARQLLKDVKGWEPVERKRPGWALEDRAAEAEREQARALAEAIELYTKALGYDPECADARRGLADLYWSRAVARRERAPAGAAGLLRGARHRARRGKYAALLRADARSRIDTNPPGADVVAYRYVERDRVLVADRGALPRADADRARRASTPGSYLIVLKRAGYRDVRYPVLLAARRAPQGEVNLYTDEEIGDDFVYVPGGPVHPRRRPGRVRAAAARSEVDVADFAIARFPVTFREYCAFLDDARARGSRARRQARAARSHAAPRGCVVQHGDARAVGAASRRSSRARRARCFPPERGPPRGTCR